MYTCETKSIEVVVEPVFLEDHSEPDDLHFVWAYHVTITNHGHETVQLKNRHWRITDANGHTIDVKGPGVVGEQPVLEPGESFEYTSGTPLKTPSGIMLGTYEMVDAGGASFDVAIPAFSLDSPHQQATVN